MRVSKMRRAGWVHLALAACLLAACAQTPVAGIAQPDAGSGLASTKVAPTKAAGTTAIPMLAAGWQMHQDAGAGYSIRYPTDVHLSTGKSKAGVYTTRIQFRVPGVEGYQGMLIRVEPYPEGAGMEEALAAIYERLMGQTPSAGLIDAFEDLNVDGLPAVRLGNAGDFAVVVPHADRLYIIAPVHSQAATALDPQALALFSQVLSTLRIQR